MVLDEAEREVLRSLKNGVLQQRALKTCSACWKALLLELKPLGKLENHNGVTGVTTGFVELDKKTAGLQPSDLIIVAARPSMGKTICNEPL